MAALGVRFVLGALLCASWLFVGSTQAQARCYDLIDYLIHDSRMGIEQHIGVHRGPQVSEFKQFTPIKCGVPCSSYKKGDGFIYKECGDYNYIKLPDEHKYDMAFVKPISKDFGAFAKCRDVMGSFYACTGHVFSWQNQSLKSNELPL